jgi:hypothetical protein
MEAQESIMREFSSLHNRYVKASERMLVLQATVVKGLRKIGTLRWTEGTRTDFITQETEIGVVLSR